MTDLAIREAGLSEAEARSLTDEVKNDAERLWRKLVELYEGGAHLVLGYSSWGGYFEQEFGGSRRRGYELLNAGKVLDSLRNSALALPANEAQANELAPLLDNPEQLHEAWAEASASGEPTARDIREVVERRTLTPEEQSAKENADRENLDRWTVTLNLLNALDHFDRPAELSDVEQEAALIDTHVLEKRGRDITPERLRRAARWASLLADVLERSHA